MYITFYHRPVAIEIFLSFFHGYSTPYLNKNKTNTEKIFWSCVCYAFTRNFILVRGFHARMSFWRHVLNYSYRTYVYMSLHTFVWHFNGHVQLVVTSIAHNRAYKRKLLVLRMVLMWVFIHKWTLSIIKQHIHQ